jgi:transposase InsO family protein
LQFRSVQFQDIVSGEFQDMVSSGSESRPVFCKESRMPWKNETMNDVRKEFALKALVQGANLTELCLEYGVTRKTGRAWRERAKRDGINQLGERSRRPRSSPTALGESKVCEVVRLKMCHPTWGPRKICDLYRRAHGTTLSRSSCHRVLKKSGLVQERRRRTKRESAVVLGAARASAPNEVWTVDFKGWWHLGNRERCEPLTVRDAFSRFILAAQVLENARAETVGAEFNRLFQLYGLPKVIKSDNGSPFASRGAPLGLSKLSASWVALGIELEHSRPAHPQDNGAHERMHKDIAAEVAAKVQPNKRVQQAALDIWREEYNHQRPHEALQDRFPGEVYCKSRRVFPLTPLRLDYGTGFFIRKVDHNGTIKCQGHRVFLTTALVNWEVGLRLVGTDNLEVWFNYLFVGTINLQTYRFGSAPSRSAKAISLAA